MNITASLAFSQLKKKRTRSMASVFAIMLSTSMTTAVCSFIVSGNAMLVGLLGDDYGEYGSAYFSMMLIPGILLGILIAAMSVIVISNVFRVSAGERIAQFGTLKCVGATGRQIVETVMYESFFLSLIGIPCGIGLGMIFTYFGIGIANNYLDELNSLVHMMMTEITFSLRFIISWKALLLSAGISFLTVLFSAYLPAKKSAKISAIDCMRGVENKTISDKRSRRKGLKQSGVIEAQLAITNVRRNRRNTKASVTVLSISIILFISLSGLRSVAENVEEYIYRDNTQTVTVDYTSNYDSRINPVTGRKEVWYSKPIDTDLAEQIANELRAFDDQEFFGAGNDYDTYFTVLSEDLLTSDMIKAQEYLEGNQKTQYEFPVEIIVLDRNHYEELCVTAGVETGSCILLNTFSYNHRGTEESIVPFSETMNTLTLETADGTPTVVEIDGILTRADIPEELLYPNTNPVRLVVPKATVRGYNWMSSPADEEGYMEYANEIMERYFPEGEADAYMELGFSTRVFKTEDYVKVMNIAIVLASVFLYSFVILLAMIGVINVISTMSTNVQMRQREFAVLQSIGMTSDSLRKMLNMESILCAGKALLFGVPIGLAIILIMNYSVRMIFPIAFCIPWKAIGVVMVLVFLLIWSTIRITASKLKEQNIIETIRR